MTPLLQHYISIRFIMCLPQFWSHLREKVPTVNISVVCLGLPVCHIWYDGMDSVTLSPAFPMAMSVCQSTTLVQTEISTRLPLNFAQTFMFPRWHPDLCDLLTFCLAPPWGWHLWFQLYNLLENCWMDYEIWYSTHIHVGISINDFSESIANTKSNI